MLIAFNAATAFAQIADRGFPNLAETVLENSFRRRILARSELWHLVALPFPVPASDTSRLTNLLDDIPFNSTPRSATLTLDKVFRFGEPAIDVQLDNIGDPSGPYLDRILFKRPPILLRWIPNMPTICEPRDRSRFVALYHLSLSKWASAKDFLVQRKLQGAAPDEISNLEETVNNAFTEMEKDNSGPVIRLFTYRSTAFASRRSSFSWYSAVELFSTSGGESAAREGRAGPVVLPAMNQAVEWHKIGEASKEIQPAFEFAIVTAIRPWLDEPLLSFLPWRWSSASPYQTRLANGETCTGGGIMNCISYRLIIVKDASTLKEPHVIGLIAELLPAQPDSRGTKYDHEEKQFRWSAYRFSDVISRLRDGTF